MEKIIVRGGKRLEGTVKVEGAKNAVLPILAATILVSVGKSKLKNVPTLSDVYAINKLLQYLNLEVAFNETNKEIEVNATNDLNFEAPFGLVSKIRASFLVMGPLLARLGRAKVYLPGGCTIGTRPIDLHLKGFKAMGAQLCIKKDYVEAFADELVGARIHLEFPSVGATQNIMMAATLAKGTTIIKNSAREPEIVDLSNFLYQMGAKVGAGTKTIRIEGVVELTGVKHSIIPDRIEAGTFMIAAAMTRGNILVEGAVLEHNKSLISKLKEMNVKIIEEEHGLRIIGPEKLKATDVKTMPHPGFPTDMQSQMTAIQMMAEGISTMTETVFENRYMHMEELRRMNAQFEVEGQTLVIYGPTKLKGAEVAATDLRAAAALILCGLCSEDYTCVSNLEYLDRGYFEFHKKLQALGADVERIKN